MTGEAVLLFLMTMAGLAIAVFVLFAVLAVPLFIIDLMSGRRPR